MLQQPVILVHLERSDVFDLFYSSLQPLALQALRSGVQLQLVKLGELPALHVDREKLAWAVTALVGNALRYVGLGRPEGDVGGSIVVRVAYEPGAEFVSVSVQDDGPGIPDDKLPFLFERRSHAPHADGLALSLVRQIVDAHGGRIEVESRRETEDHGTSITLSLPLRR